MCHSRSMVGSPVPSQKRSASLASLGKGITETWRIFGVLLQKSPTETWLEYVGVLVQLDVPNSHNGWLMKKEGFLQKGAAGCPFPIGWLMNFFWGLSERPPWKPQVSMMIDGINHNPAPLFLPKGHYCPGVVGKHKLWIVAKSTSNSE